MAVDDTTVGSTPESVDRGPRGVGRVPEDAVSSTAAGYWRLRGRNSWVRMAKAPTGITYLGGQSSECAFLRRSRTPGQTLTIERWFLSVCVRHEGIAGTVTLFHQRR